jgi:hypothetical protein
MERARRKTHQTATMQKALEKTGRDGENFRRSQLVMYFKKIEAHCGGEAVNKDFNRNALFRVAPRP